MSDHGGAEKVYAEMANNFLKKGHIVCALYFDNKYGGGKNFFSCKLWC